MTHPRVTPEGQRLGRISAMAADSGRQRLEAHGLTGAGLPALRQDMCRSCACRPGSVPNGCLQTQLDFLKAVTEGKPFLCHAPMDGRMCAGWVGARAEVVARPLPQEAQDLLARWEYSPAEDPDAAGGAA